MNQITVNPNINFNTNNTNNNTINFNEENEKNKTHKKKGDNDKNKFQVKVKGSAKKILQKLEKYDERSLEKHVLMINNSITVLSEQFRKEFQDFQ